MAEQQEFSPHHRADVDVFQDGSVVTLKVQAGDITLTADEAQELASRIFEASALASGADPGEKGWVRLPMQYIRAEVERLDFGGQPEEASVETGETDDPEMNAARVAVVHCWIKDQTQQNAMHIASGWIAEHGWMIGELLEQRPVARSDFAATDYLQYFEQALTDGELFLYEIEDDGEETEGTEDAT